jgi:hypothetical protein
MGISSCFVALLLAWPGPLVDFDLTASLLGLEHEDSLTVHIRKSEPKKDSNHTTANKSVRLPPPEQKAPDSIAEVQQELPPVDSPRQAVELQPEKDWHAIAKEVVRTIDATNSRQEESRAYMWQRSRSIMFEPADDIVLNDEAPLLSDIRFIRRSRVLGLGFNFGSCFFGIPIAGVPVEDRSVAITLFVCTSES